MSEGDQRATHRHPVLVGALKAAAVVLLLVVAAFSLHGKLPSLSAVGDALAGADTGWLAVAVVAEFVSMGMVARQQRRLLAALGVRMPRPDYLVGQVISSTLIWVVLPLAVGLRRALRTELK